jgi:hypothetical protein
LAEKLGCTEAKLDAMFADDGNPSIRFVARALDALGYSPKLTVVRDDRQCPVCRGKLAKGHCPALEQALSPDLGGTDG